MSKPPRRKRTKPKADGRVTWSAVTLHRDGVPLRAGEIREGQIVEYNALTGEVTAIRDATEEDEEDA